MVSRKGEAVQIFHPLPQRCRYYPAAVSVGYAEHVGERSASFDVFCNLREGVLTFIPDNNIDLGHRFEDLLVGECGMHAAHDDFYAGIV